MPVPTEMLQEEIRTIYTKLDAIALALTDILKQLSVAQTELRFVKWIGAFAATFLAGLFVSIIALTGNASALNSEVKQQGTRLERIEQQLGRVIERIDQPAASKPAG